jgi:hypothetical protein
MADEKINVVRFSLPYREGMENENGYKGKTETTSKTFPGETVFGAFEFPLDNSIEVAEADALATGYKVLRQNKQRAGLISTYAGKYSISAPGVTGGITKTDLKLIDAMLAVTNNVNKIVQAFKLKTGKDIDAEEVSARMPK